MMIEDLFDIILAVYFSLMSSQSMAVADAL